MELEPIDPETAFELYIAEKETSVADATVASHKSRLSFLLRWCAERDIENLNDLPAGGFRSSGSGVETSATSRR